MVEKFKRVSVLYLRFNPTDVSSVVHAHKGVVRLEKLRSLIGQKLMKEVLLHCHAESSDRLEAVLSTLIWRVRLGSQKIKDGRLVERLVYLRYQVVRDECGQQRFKQRLIRLKFRYKSSQGLDGELRLLTAKGV